MKDYWLTVNDIDKVVNVVFRNSNFDLVNILFHMVDISWLEELETEIENLKQEKNRAWVSMVKKYGPNAVLVDGRFDGREDKQFAGVLVYKGTCDKFGHNEYYTRTLRLPIFKNALHDYIRKYHEVMSE